MEDEPWESSDCGYIYQKLLKQRCVGYTMTATAHWSVTWAVLGKTGTIPVATTATTRLPIIEAQSLNVDPDEYDDPDQYEYVEPDDPNEPANSTSACPRRTSTPPTPTPTPTSQPAPMSPPTPPTNPPPTPPPGPNPRDRGWGG